MRKRTLFTFTVILATIFIFSGCRKELTPTAVYTPSFHIESTVEVGEVMFEKTFAHYKYIESVTLLDEVDRKRYGETYHRKYYFKKETDNKCLMIMTKHDLIKLVDENCDGTFTLDRNEKKLEKPVEYTVIQTRPVPVRNKSYKHTVVYQGKIGNKLNISFQEFVPSRGGFRLNSALTQNIQYELDANGEAMIGFKGLRIKVLSSNKFDITYRVIKDYN